ncbi:MAG: response regulator transcription factor [Bryobacterales bacterium]|nr:response regulator transcription factor [Bryobacterales bacterium]
MSPNRTEPVRVFLVEDAAVIRDRYRDELRAMPHLTLCGEAVSASEAIAGIEQNHPDVVLLDLELEQSSGTEVLEALANCGSPPHFVVVTNHVDPTMRDRCFRMGATHFFDKNRQFLELLEFLQGL